MMDQYHTFLEQHSARLASLQRTYNWISTGRLVVALLFILTFYYYTITTSIFLLLGLVVEAIGFLILLRYHQRIEWEKNFTNGLMEINQNEIDFLTHDQFPFEDGARFTDPTHAYSYDLDLFGERSLYQYLNRSGTIMGEEALAQSLLTGLPQDKIKQTQQTVEELAPKIAWRQKILGLSKINPDSKESYEHLMEWAVTEEKQLPKALYFLSYLLPVVVIGSAIVSLVTPFAILGNLAFLTFLINLGILGTQLKTIKNEFIPSTEIDKILKQYARTLHEIEHAHFESPLLVSLQQRLLDHGKQSSQLIHHLSTLFLRMDHVQNIFASPLLNGFLLFHIHVLRDLINWRRQHASHIKEWLSVIGELEKLSSLSNFLCNNPGFAFPTLTTDFHISFKEVGHPLIREEKRISNDVDFQQHRFFILTGSNMSGKSTFLRTLGINMVLGSIGAPVCAKAASIHPLPIWVSMRLSDSLSDSESYFFAEVKRLKTIMDQLDEGVCFVLLDEILRGTNSDDKRSGTIQVIRKMVQKKAIGMIATHDLEVCKTADEYPAIVANKRFEVAIEKDELVFDYLLRDGVCENKSATFLMRKMGVIDSDPK